MSLVVDLSSGAILIRNLVSTCIPGCQVTDAMTEAILLCSHFAITTRFPALTIINLRDPEISSDLH